MALLNCIYNSRILGAKTAMNVVLPENVSDINSAPVFTLLHGLDGNYLTWCANTRIQELAEKYGVCVIMPEAKNSFYCKTAQGEDYYTHIADEVFEVSRRFFGLGDKPELNHIAGISMGGFGAMKIGLLNPTRFATIGSLSSVMDVEGQLIKSHGLNAHEREVLKNAFGENARIRGGENDIFYLSERVAGKCMPAIYQFCGTEDFLYADNRRYLSFAKSLSLDITYEEAPGGHFWPVWAEQIWHYVPWAIRRAEG